jgi:hypothetical protein
MQMPLSQEVFGLHSCRFITLDHDGQQKQGVGFEDKVRPF